MFPAEHRALRELHATARELRGHWGKLAERLDQPVLADGAQAADELLTELEQRIDLSGRPTAQSVGARLAGARGVSDLLLERNQAFRSALLDLQHVIDAARLPGRRSPRTREDADLAAWHDRLARPAAGARGPGTRRGQRDGGRSGARDRARRRGHAGPRRARKSVSRWARSAKRSTIRPRSAGPPPLNLKEFAAMSVDVVVAVPAFMDMTFVGLEGLPALGEERFAGDLVRTPGGGAITAIGCARLGLATALAAPLGAGRGRRPDRRRCSRRGRPARRPALPAHAGHRRDADRPRARDGHLRPRRPRPRGRRRRAVARAP